MISLAGGHPRRVRTFSMYLEPRPPWTEDVESDEADCEVVVGHNAMRRPRRKLNATLEP